MLRSHVFRTASIALLAAVLLASVAHAQTVDEIVNRNIEAKGGVAKWKAISSVKMTGRITAQGMEVPMTVYAMRPNYTRQEMTVKNTKLVQAFDGTTGWLVNPMMGETPQELPAPISEMMKNTADFDGPLLDYKAKGHTIELVGRDKVDGTEVHHLQVTMKGGQVQHYYLDAETGIELKKTEEVDIGTGQKQTLETRMADYRAVDGVMVPHKITQLMDGKPVAQMSIDKVQFNAPDIAEALFRMPGK